MKLNLPSSLKVGKLRVHRVRKRFFENGMSGVFNLSHGGGRSKQIDGDFEAHLIALSCGEPPEGHSQWSLRLLADKMVELEYVESVSHETVRQVLKNCHVFKLIFTVLSCIFDGIVCNKEQR